MHGHVKLFMCLLPLLLRAMDQVEALSFPQGSKVPWVKSPSLGILKEPPLWVPFGPERIPVSWRSVSREGSLNRHRNRELGSSLVGKELYGELSPQPSDQRLVCAKLFRTCRVSCSRCGGNTSTDTGYAEQWMQLSTDSNLWFRDK